MELLLVKTHQVLPSGFGIIFKLLSIPRLMQTVITSQGENDGRNTTKGKLLSPVEVRRVSERGMLASVVTIAALENHGH